MKVKIDKVLESVDKTSKSNKPYTLTTFTDTDGKLYKDVYGKFEAGQEVEGEWKTDDYGTKFEVAKSNSGFKGGFSKSDPDTMLIAYAKDLVVAFITAGVIKDEKEAASQLVNFSKITCMVYDKRKSGADLKVKEKQTSASANEESNDKVKSEETTDEQIEQDIDSIPF